MPRKLSLAVALIALASACVGSTKPATLSTIPPIKGKPLTAFALRHVDVVVGAGVVVAPRKCLFVHYTGWLTNGTKFDSSRDTMPNGTPRTPLGFPQGSRRVIAGWDLGFEGMKVGGQRRLFIPYQLAYGEAGRVPTIPARSELIFDVELMAVADTMPRATEPVSRGQPPPPPQCPTWANASGTR